MTGYKCIACGSSWPHDHGPFTCTTCGGNLEALYDYNALRDALDPSNPFPGRERNDLFRYLPLLPLHGLEGATPLRVGATPLYPSPRLAQRYGLKHLYLKDDSANPSNSFKDRASAVALARAVENNARVVAGASTGNAGSSMACLSASLGMPCVVFVPEHAPPAKIAQLMLYGARVLAVRGSYDDAFDLCMKVCEQKKWFNRNTGHNPFTREGKKTTSFEICEQLNGQAPNHIIVSAGDGNIISGVWKGFREWHALGLTDRIPHIHAAQAEGSAAISRAVKTLRAKNIIPDNNDWRTVPIEPVQAHTLADSISVDQPRDGLAAVRAVIETHGEAITVDDETIIRAVKDLSRITGLFAEPSSAIVLAALEQLCDQNVIAQDDRVVLLLTGNGLKDSANAIKAAGQPEIIDASLEVALDALDL